MKTITLIGLLAGLLADGVYAQKPPAADLLKFQFLATNSAATNNVSAPSRLVVEPAATSPETASTNLIPLIQFSDVPITSGIENLARQAGINYLLALDLFVDDQGNRAAEPEVTCRWEKITARDALIRICDEHELSLVENPYTHIARIVRAGQRRNFVDAALLGLSTNQPVARPEENKDSIPLIEFSDVPLDTAFINLIKQSGRSIELASNLMENVAQSIDAKGKVAFHDLPVPRHHARDAWFDQVPVLSIRWENVRSEEGIVALCENYDLEIVKDVDTGNLEITPRKIKRHHRVGH